MPEILRLTLGWGCVLLSLLGWSSAITMQFRLKAELSVPLGTCCVILLTYVFGLCGSLLVGAVATAAAGIALLLYVLLKDKSTFAAFANPGFAFLLLFGIFIATQVYNDSLSHNDDFNHWAVIARNMLLRDAFPDKTVTAIDFSSYPPGTALFIYYVNRIASSTYSEGRLILSQNILVLLLLPALFAPLTENTKENAPVSRRIWPMLCAAALLIFLYEFRALIVDVVNGVIGFAAVACVLTLRDQPKKAAASATLLTAVGLLVKYSNIYYFAVTAIALLWVCVRAKERGEKTHLGAMLLGGALCILTAASWFVHVQIAFGGVADTHSMNAGRILDVLCSWSKDDIRTIFRVCVRMATNLRKSSVLLTAFMNGFALALALAQKILFKKSPCRILRAILLADLCYLGYQCMLFCAYILSFPRDEALRGASYGRYNMSIMIWVIGFLSSVCVREMLSLPRTKAAKHWTSLVSIGFACVTIASLAITGEGATLFNKVPYVGTRQAAADTILFQNTFADTDTFFVLAADQDAKQVASVFHYKTNRHVDFAHVDAISDMASLKDACADHTYLIILEDDSRILSLTGGLSIGAYLTETLP